MGLLIVVLWAATFLLPRFIPDPDKRAAFGDMFGAVSALFSGLAFLGVIVAILLQRQDLVSQSEDLKLTREELRGQKEQLQAQNETLRRQAFENTFFEMLRLHHEIVNAMALRSGSHTVTNSGRECFREHLRSLQKVESEITQRGGSIDRLTVLKAAYGLAYKGGSFQTQVGHYFRNLYHIIKFVHNSAVREKRFYTNLVRAQLSALELVLLFYNCLSEFGREKFKPLVEEYALLHTLPKDELLDPQDRTLYAESAFGDYVV